MVTHLSHNGEEVTLNLEGTNLERFRGKSDTLRYIDRVTRNSKLRSLNPS